MNEVIYQWLGNIFKQLHLSGINTKYFFEGVLCLKNKKRENIHHTLIDFNRKCAIVIHYSHAFHQFQGTKD